LIVVVRAERVAHRRVENSCSRADQKKWDQPLISCRVESLLPVSIAHCKNFST
jgi:hypothetical protein